ncbi:hypothetical protein L484_023798 [Morus notabilis]|uniref:C2 domain-containing protein n=1 Tax=Morus notabilis TaxID=981085 RepID=W9R568_9ROSA|nr:uncharacterized protein LOC21406552 [Morus notabilis]EXB70613.1 hypothetical protein L484_023798 [Morus notabilis]
MSNLKSSTRFQLLEINLVSAYDLKPPRTMFTSRKDHHQIYAVVWIDPKQKLKSRVLDAARFENARSNDKFVFVVDAKTLDSWSAAQLVVEFYCVGRFGNDRLIGTSRVLLGSFGNCGRRFCETTTGTFRGFHIRRPNGDAKGILHIGITILDGLACDAISDQFVGIGSPIDCQKLTGVGAAANKMDNKGAAAFIRRLFSLHG